MRRPAATALLVGSLIGWMPTAGVAQTAPASATGDSSSSTLVSSSPAEAPAAVVVADAGPDGFGLRSSDGSFRLRFQGLAHYDGRAFFDDDADRYVDGFEIRRVRADVRGTVYGQYDFRVHLDYAGNRVEVLDAYAEGRFSPAVQVRVGKFKAPVGLERLRSASALAFPERAFPTALAPNRDVGLQVQGAVAGQVINYAVGVFNGVPDGASGDTDLTDSKDLAGRLVVQPFVGADVAALRGLSIGVAATIGDQRAPVGSPGLPSLRTAIGRNIFLRFRSDGTEAGTVVLDGRRTRISPQGSWYWGPFGLVGEYIRSTGEVRLGEQNDELTNSAWHLLGSWVLTGEAASDRGVSPARSFDPSGGSWGALEIVGRLHGISTDSPALLAGQSAESASAFAVGLNWYLNRFVKVQAAYEHTSFGVPQGEEPPAESIFVTRFQFAF